MEMAQPPATDLRLADVLARLSNEVGVSGRERAVRKLIRELIAGLALDHVEVDALGNLSVFKAGTGPEPRLRVMLAAHMDEVGLMITRIDKSGLLHFHIVGGVEERLLAGKRVVIGDEKVPGVIGAPVPHLQSAEQARKAITAADLLVDIGANSDKEAEAKVKVGDYGTFATSFTLLGDDPAWPAVRGKALDDRVGCTALVGLLAGSYPVDVVGVFTVQEEVGLRGAGVASYRLQPDAAIVLEGTICDDAPRPPDEDETPVTRLGDGPALTIMDRSFVAHPGLLALLRESATAEGLAIQYKAPLLGGTDAGSLHTARGGVPTAVVAVPCRYIHGPAAILNLDDLTCTVSLVGAALRRLDRHFLQREE